MKRFFLLLFLPLFINSQSLWIDTDPYSTGQKIKVGSIIKVRINDGLTAVYESEYAKDENGTIKTNPDKKLIPENIAYNADRVFTSKKKGKNKSSGKILGTMAVTINSIDSVTGNIQIFGSRESLIDKEKIAIRLSGVISYNFIKPDKSVNSENVANLRIEFESAPSKEILSNPDIKLKETSGIDGVKNLKAELSEEERQKIILNQIKRLLGESQY